MIILFWRRLSSRFSSAERTRSVLL
ncbi:BnaCnng50790D [Brassica napus]|uniref:BnaCnng50790D protein n=1 Tax=Brassica napus TaxID=3708 RepID=A0A078JIZ2_BRANA|nr:BnaCnng50790D [Brassica napus]